MRLQHSPRTVAGIRFHAKRCHGSVSLVSVQQIGGELRCLTESERQKSGRHRIERSAVPGLRRVQQAAGRLQFAVRARAFPLIQEEYAVHAVAMMTSWHVTSPDSDPALPRSAYPSRSRGPHSCHTRSEASEPCGCAAA